MTSGNVKQKVKAFLINIAIDSIAKTPLTEGVEFIYKDDYSNSRED